MLKVSNFSFYHTVFILIFSRACSASENVKIVSLRDKIFSISTGNKQSLFLFYANWWRKKEIQRMELFTVFVPVHMWTNLFECPIQTQFVRQIEKLKSCNEKVVKYTISDNVNNSDLLNLWNTELYICQEFILFHW